MTSASTKVNQSLFDQFVLNRDNIMPACVAALFPRMDNGVYRDTYSREARTPESSSPETASCEEYHNQYPQMHSYPEKYSGRSAFSAISEAKRKRGDIFPNKMMKNKMVSDKSNVREPSNRAFDDCASYQKNQKQSLGPDSEPLEVAEVTQSSLKSNHPLKKRILQSNADNHVNGKLKGLGSSTTSKCDKTATKKCAQEAPSSEILQKMYVSFGPNIHSHLNRFNHNNRNAFNSRSGEESGDESGKEEKERKLNGNTECASAAKSGEKRKKTKMQTARNGLRPTEYNEFDSQAKPSEALTNGVGRVQDLNQDPATSKQFADSSGATAVPKSVKAKAKSRREEKPSRKRKHSIDSRSQPKRSHDSEAALQDVEEKRTRYSSSESSDSQSRRQQSSSFSQLYKQNGSWLPFVNPLFYPQAALGAFGMPSPGCHFPFPGFSQPNPLMLNANPYLANQVMMRDMMPFLWNSVPTGSALSPQQMNAFQQLQSTLLHQNPASFFPANNYQASSGILPTVSNPLLAAGRRIPYCDSTASERQSNESGKSQTPESGSSTEVQEQCRNGLLQTNQEGKQKFSQFSPLTKQKSFFDPDEQTNLYAGNKSFLNGNTKTKRVNLEKSFSSVKRGEKSRTQQLPTKYRPPQTTPKKKSEKKKKETTKCKDMSFIEKNAPNPKVKEMQMKGSEEEMEETLINPSESPPLSGSGKSPSYKNLTRERRLVANARERTRVHTISSAFDELRSQIPSYSCNQKLSKLAILRIACEYIRTLSVLTGHEDELSLGQGVDRCTRVLQSESRARSRRKNNKAQIEWEMVNYERHRSQDDGYFEATPGGDPEPKQSPETNCGRSPEQNPASNSTDDNEPADSSLASCNDVTADDVTADDVTENDNELVDVESLDDDKTENNI